MGNITDICFGIAAIAGMVAVFVLVIKLQTVLLDFYVTAAGFEIRLFRLWPIYRLKFEDIVQVRVTKGYDILREGFLDAAYRSITLGNRLSWRGVLIEKGGWIRFLRVTPADPEAFVSEIRRHISR